MKKYMLSILLLNGFVASIFASSIQVKVVQDDTISSHVINDIDLQNDTVESIKNSIEQILNIPFEQQRLIFGGRELSDPQEGLQALGLKEGSTVYLLRSTGVPVPPVQKKLTQKQIAGLTLAALTAAVGSFIKFRLYQNTKKRLAKKYKLGNLTPLQGKIWLATILASYRIPWRLRALVRNNEGSLEDFVGKDPRAVAELYYGHAPSKEELDAFIQKFFADIVGK